MLLTIIDGLFSNKESQRIIFLLHAVSGGDPKLFFIRARTFKNGGLGSNAIVAAKRSREMRRAIKLGPIGILKNDWYEEIWWIAETIISCGQSEVPTIENGQPLSIWLKGWCIIMKKLQNTSAKNDTSMSEVMIFLNKNDILIKKLKNNLYLFIT